MASEIQFNITFSAAKGGAATSSINRTTPADMTGTGMGDLVQLAGHAADSALALPGSVTGNYWVMVYNMDPTNFVSISTGTGGAFAAAVFAVVPAGLTAGPFLCTRSLYVKADTADCNIFSTLCQA